MFSFFSILLAPVFGGFIYGIERVLKARIQNRVGPPIMQPFYDLFKLADKRQIIVHSFHASLGVMHFIALWITVAMFILGADLLMIIFFHLLANSLLIIAGFSVKSSYSHIGAIRELISTLSYEPILILIAIAMYLLTGSFEVSKILNSNIDFLVIAPLFVALLIALPIKLKKSPFDVAEAHQEIIGGVEIEYSGLFYEALYSAKWLEYIFVYMFVYMFAGDNYLLGLALVGFTFLIINLVDNATARVNYSQMVQIVFISTISIGFVNLLFLI